MNSNRTKIIAIGGVALFIIIGALVYLNSRGHKTGPSSTGQSQLPDAHPPKEVISLATKYAQLRENAVGANQASLTSWFVEIQPISTSSWMTKLQSPSSGSAGSGAGEYALAHGQHFIVKGVASDCVWQFKIAIPTDTSGVVSCALYDTTADQATGSTLSASSLPFGWSRSGQQTPITLSVIKKAGKWLVDEDISGGD